MSSREAAETVTRHWEYKNEKKTSRRVRLFRPQNGTRQKKKNTEPTRTEPYRSHPSTKLHNDRSGQVVPHSHPCTKLSHPLQQTITPPATSYHSPATNYHTARCTKLSRLNAESPAADTPETEKKQNASIFAGLPSQERNSNEHTVTAN